MGVDLGATNAPAIVRAGIALLANAREQIEVKHPTDPSLNMIDLLMLHGHADDPRPSQGATA